VQYRLPLISSVVALAALAGGTTANAARLHDQRVVASPKPTPARESSTAAPLVAPQAACPGQTRLSAPPEAQEEAMRCMTGYAREQAGLSPLAESEALGVSAGNKLNDLLSCDEFSHFACGRRFSPWIEETGYMSTPCSKVVGENLAWGMGDRGTVRAIFRAWMRSPSHRANILWAFDETGVSLGVGELEGRPGVRVWVQHFGTRCEASAGAAAE
jgi:uncharacterized protein YkwD